MPFFRLLTIISLHFESKKKWNTSSFFGKKLICSTFFFAVMIAVGEISYLTFSSTLYASDAKLSCICANVCENIFILIILSLAQPKVDFIILTFEEQDGIICARLFFFHKTNFDFLNINFWHFLYYSKSIVVLGSKFWKKKTFHLWSFFVKLWGFKHCQCGTINTRYHSKCIVVLSLNLKNYFTCDHFS